MSCLLAAGALPGVAHGQGEFTRYLTAADRLYEGLEYEQALAQIHRAKQWARGVEQDVAVALREGIILADMNKREESVAAFKVGLLLNPEAKLPFKVSPKVARAFEEVRERVRQELARAPRSDRPEQPAPPRLDAPVRPPPSPAAPSVEARPRSKVPMVPLVLAGTGAVSAGVAAWFGLQSRSNLSEARQAYAGGLPIQSELPQVNAHMEDARSQARVANVLFGTAALALGGAVVTYLLAPDSKDAATQEVP